MKMGKLKLLTLLDSSMCKIAAVCYALVMDFPVLHKLRDLAVHHDPIDFSNTVLVAVQHILITNGSMLEILNSLGLSYDRMFVLGKVYSTNELVFDELKRRGVHLHPSSLVCNEVTLKNDYKTLLSDAADELLSNALDRIKKSEDATKTLLVVDDGGVLISTVNNRANKIDVHIVAVEQTRSGAETIRAIPELSIPIVNVAESNKKLRDESPYIAAAIIRRIIVREHALHFRLKDCRVLIVGDGAIGSQVAQQLRKLSKSVESYDINKAKRGQDADHIYLENMLPGKDLIIGCTGKKWMPNNYRTLLKDGVVLASGSSSNTEFLGIDLNEEDFFESTQEFKRKDLKKVHRDYTFNLINGKGRVLNAGFPVNFDGYVEIESNNEIELTRMLMLSGIYQAVGSTMPGLTNLNFRF